MTTIAAVATPTGAGGIAIIRVSGPDALKILKKAFSRKKDYAPNMLYHGYVLGPSGEYLDEAMAVYMKAPHSYTAEDVCEIQCHGGDVSAKRCLSAVLSAGAVPAAPGEFTKRAFLNGRIDLSQAEAVMQLISARSEAAARASLRQLTGGVSAKIRAVTDALLGITALIEAADDFPEEIDEEAGSSEAREKISAVISELDLMADARAAAVAIRGASVVLAGRPNVGKSSILNALVGAERAIVTSVPGTTRDVLTERVSINGVEVELTDTAGRRDTSDAVEKIGVERARRAAEGADVVLIILDADAGLDESDRELLSRADEKCVAVINKQDAGAKIDVELICGEYNIETVVVSALTGAGLDKLRSVIARRVAPREPELTAQRHLEAAARARDALKNAVSAIDGGFPLDVCSIDIMTAMNALSEITGENARESVIDRVFSDFCVGK